MKMPAGFLRFHTMRLLNERPRYGYEIIKELEKKFGTKPSQGTIYPILHNLENNGFVEATWDVEEKGLSRKYYYITKKGEEEFEKSKEKLMNVFNTLFESEEEKD